MPNLTPGQTLSTPDAQIEIEGLGPGRHRLSLTVVDEFGQESSAAQIEVVIRPGNRPTAVLDVVDEDGNRVEPVGIVGGKIFVSGRRSIASSGDIAEYRFTLLP